MHATHAHERQPLASGHPQAARRHKRSRPVHTHLSAAAPRPLPSAACRRRGASAPARAPPPHPAAPPPAPPPLHPRVACTRAEGGGQALAQVWAQRRKWRRECRRLRSRARPASAAAHSRAPACAPHCSGHCPAPQRTRLIAREVGAGPAGGAREARGLPPSCSSNPCVTCGRGGPRGLGTDRATRCRGWGRPGAARQGDPPARRSQRRRRRPPLGWLPGPWLPIALGAGGAARERVGQRGGGRGDWEAWERPRTLQCRDRDCQFAAGGLDRPARRQPGWPGSAQQASEVVRRPQAGTIPTSRPVRNEPELPREPGATKLVRARAGGPAQALPRCLGVCGRVHTGCKPSGTLQLRLPSGRAQWFVAGAPAAPAAAPPWCSSACSALQRPSSRRGPDITPLPRPRA